MRKTKIYKSLPYNPNLRKKAKALRKAGILHEVLLWLELKSKKLNGLDFDRQKIIGNYIVDFYCAEKAVVIEVDGSSHNEKQAEDAKRDVYLNSLGLTVIRITAEDVLRNLDEVVAFLKDHPALSGTPPKEGNKIRTGSVIFRNATTSNTALSGVPSQEGDKGGTGSGASRKALTEYPGSLRSALKPLYNRVSNLAPFQKLVNRGRPLSDITNKELGGSSILVNPSSKAVDEKDHPALSGTPPKEGNKSRTGSVIFRNATTSNTALSGVPSKEGNKGVSILGDLFAGDDAARIAVAERNGLGRLMRKLDGSYDKI